MNDTADNIVPRNILEAVRMMRPEMRKSDRKVADTVLETPIAL